MKEESFSNPPLPPAPASRGREPDELRRPQIMPSSQEKTTAVMCHVGGFLTSIIVPIIFWVMNKDKSRFVTHHSREAVNHQITLMLAYVIDILLLITGGVLGLMHEDVAVAAVFTIVGFVFIALLLVFELICIALASMAAGQGRLFHYPLCIRALR